MHVAYPFYIFRTCDWVYITRNFISSFPSKLGQHHVLKLIESSRKDARGSEISESFDSAWHNSSNSGRRKDVLNFPTYSGSFLKTSVVILYLFNIFIYSSNLTFAFPVNLIIPDFTFSQLLSALSLSCYWNLSTPEIA